MMIKYVRTTLIIFSILIPLVLIYRTGFEAFDIAPGLNMPTPSRLIFWLGLLISNLGELAISPLCLFAAYKIKPFEASGG